MPELILHHYEMSPFSEKARRMIAWKKIGFRSVRAPAVMPKPDLVALTGGYRKIPVVQMGNHIYCDTALIGRVLEALAPSPTLYPSPMAEAVAEWADTALFEVVVAVAFRPTRFDDLLKWMHPDELAKMVEDRAAMRADARRKGPTADAAKAALPLYLGRIDGELQEKAFLLGTAPTIADFSTYHPIWFLQKLAPEHLVPFANVRAWAERVRAIEGAEGVPMTSEEALTVARESPPNAFEDEFFDGSSGLSKGQKVVVRPLDYGRDPVVGELARLAHDEIALCRNDVRAGTVFVHFPRLGFDVRAADGFEVGSRP